LAQSEVALLPATGIVLNNNDLEGLKVIKDADGRYIGGGPFGPPIRSIWGRPVVGTPQMDPGDFLVGAFRDGAQLYDRETVQVLISSENEDDFTRNLLTILVEERLAFAVKRPQAFIYGVFP
jgi:HK97 family phage major capsid protein